jgi:hypothetical protein
VGKINIDQPAGFQNQSIIGNSNQWEKINIAQPARFQNQSIIGINNQWEKST